MKTLRRSLLLVATAAASLAALAPAANAVEPTVLCKNHEDPCKEANVVKSLHLEDTGFLLLSDLLDILCLNSLLQGKVLGPEAASIDVETLSWTSCGSNKTHNNCTVTTKVLPSLTLERTALNLAVAALKGAQANVQCTIGGIFKIDCTYSIDSELTLEGALHKEGSGHGMLKSTSITPKVAGGGLCPSTTAIDGFLYEPLEHTYVVSETELAPTVLCKNHEDPCKEANVVKSLHLEDTGFLLLSDLLDILCLNSLLQGKVLGPEAASIDVETLSWTSCGSNKTHNNCTVTTKVLPSLTLERTALNLAVAALKGAQANVQCTIGGIFKIDCTYSIDSELTLEGALHKEGSGHGMLKSTSITPKVAGGGLCPSTTAIDGFLYEPLEHTYVVSEVELAPTVLCKNHEDPCKESNVIKSLHLEDTGFLLLSDIVDVLCLNALLQGKVLGPEAASVDVETLSWTNCGSNKTHNNCTVTTKVLPSLALERTALNLAVAALKGAQANFQCTIAGFIKIDCTYSIDSELTLEGALHKEGVGHGMLKSTSITPKVAGGGLCPSTTAIDGFLYEPLEHTYVVSEAS